MNLRSELEKHLEYATNLRRHFHQYPEIGWEEFNTAKTIREYLDSYGIPYEIVAETGTIATLKGKDEKAVIGMRCDIDALPITELNDVEYKSKNEGIMHACGHDSHIAMLLTAAKILSEHKDELECTIKFIFQPAEEKLNGALSMLESGLLDDLDTIIGMHIFPQIESGKVSVEAGPRFTAAAFMNIEVIGKSGHGAMPQYVVDPIYVGAKIVDGLQSIVSREVSPQEAAVVSICTFHSGSLPNIFDRVAKLSGTVRTFNNELRQELPKIIERIISNTCKAYRADYKLDYEMGVPATVNDARCSEIAKRAVINGLGEDKLAIFEKTPGGEDFSYYLEKFPGVYAFVGCRNEEKDCAYSLHHEKFNIDESSMMSGVGFYIQYMLEFLHDQK